MTPPPAHWNGHEGLALRPRIPSGPRTRPARGLRRPSTPILHGAARREPARRAFLRSVGPELARSIALVCLADALVGASFGTIAVSTGFPLWLPVLLTVVVFAGASQFLFLGLLAAGGSPLAAAAAGLLVNARHLPFGFAIADVFSRLDGAISGRRQLLYRLIGAHVLTDEATAFTLTTDDPVRRRVAYWASSIALFVVLNLSVWLGGLAGTIIEDTNALGLDAAFPAVLLALVLPALRDPATRWASLIGVVVSLATSPLLPAGAPVLLALSGVVCVALFRRSESSAPSPQPEPKTEAATYS